MEYKICSKCGIKKLLSEFNKKSDNKDGLNSKCKLCCALYWKEYCLKNNAKRKKYNKEYMLINKNKYREYHKIYDKEYYRKNIKKERQRHKKYAKSFALYDTFANQISYAESTRQDPRNLDLLQIKCVYCGKWFNPANQDIKNRIQALQNLAGRDHNLYCSQECKRLCPTYRRVSRYKFQEGDYSREVQPELRQMVFERDEWVCIKCGETVGLQCHHIEGIQWNPIESADIDICVTFCVKCHEEAHKDEGCRYYDMRCN